MIPGLLKWIDKAKEEQYVLEARNVYLAAEAQITEEYAGSTTAAPTATEISSGSTFTSLADVTDPKVEGIKYAGTTDTDMFEVQQITVSFESNDGKKITATMEPNKTWTINKIGDKTVVTPPTYS